jgi:hypothetical protein
MDEPGRDRVVDHVADRGPEMFVVADLPRPEALLEEVALAAVAAIEPLRVESQHALHHPAQLRRRRHVDDHVEVRAEQRPCQQLDSEHLRGAM